MSDGLSPDARCEGLEPGLVLIRNALDVPTQVAVAQVAMDRGRDGERGFWTSGGELNSSKACSRGRVFDAIDTFDASLPDLCAAAVVKACAVDPLMPPMVATHLLMVYYTAGRGIFWHRDDAPNDGQNEHPVVSFSLGNTCSFGLCHQWSWQRMKESSRKIDLRSGDAILFGGPCRYIHHAVLGVQRGSAPPELAEVLGNTRLNLTFRDAPSVAGLEDTTYKYYQPPSSVRKPKGPGKRKRADAQEAAGSHEPVADDSTQ